jgi:heptosyltransferase-2
LPSLAAVLERAALFLGHDSGISHLAAAVSAPCLLLFGPTDPAIWAPANHQVRIAIAPNGDLSALSLEAVQKEIASAFPELRG